MKSRKEDVKKTYRLRGAKPGMTLRWLFAVLATLSIIAFGIVSTGRQAKRAGVEGRDIDVGQTELTAEAIAESKAAYRSTYEVALASARTWDVAATLVKADQTDTGWSYLFVSEGKKGKGYTVDVADMVVLAFAEQAFVGQGAPLPENILSKEQAMEKVRSIPGYEHAEMLGVEMMYGADGAEWYWGVRTSLGTVTVNARNP